MNRLPLILIAVASLAPAQTPPVTPRPPVAPLAPLPPLPPELPDIDAILRNVKPQIQAALAMADFQVGVASSSSSRRVISDDTYDAGTRALDERRYDDAITRFDRVIAAKSDRADRALYWKAYALNRLGRRDDALATIAQLRKDYASSRWLNDAQALEVEVRQGSGQRVSPETEANEDLKLMAINGLMSADPDRALPLLEGLLKGSAAPRLKDRALFVITQSNAPKAKQILADYAKGAGNPDLQSRAIRYIGMAGNAESQQQLSSIYAASNDPAIKREVMRGLMLSKARDPLFNLARTEKDADLRGEAIRLLGAMRASEQLAQLYGAETDAKVKQNIVRSLFVAGDAKSLVDVARKETNPELKKTIVSSLSMMKSKEATDYLMELLK